MTKHFYSIFAILVILFIIRACHDKKTDSLQNQGIKQQVPQDYLPPKIIPANFDSLPKITPGENGVPLPVVVKSRISQIHQIPGLPIIPGVSHLPQSSDEKSANRKPKMSQKPKVVKVDKKQLPVHTMGKRLVKMPIVYKIPKPGNKKQNNNSFTIQYGDTIYPPIEKTYPTPKPEPALSPTFRDNITKNIRCLGTKEGLSAIIWSILEDSKGNIWFATFEGAIRYDGYSFAKYTNKEGLLHNWVSSIFEDNSGRIWFLHTLADGGVSCFDGQNFTHYKKEQGLCSNKVNSMFQDKSGKLWFATSNGLNCFNGESFTNYTTKQGLCNNYVLKVFEAKSGKLWIGTLGGISCLDGKSFTNYTPENGFYNANSILEDKDGWIWFGGFGVGLSCYDGESITYFTKKQGLCSNNILNDNLIKDSKGNIWIGTDKGLSCFDGKSFTNLSTEKGLSHNIITAITEDKSGNLWIGTRGEGAMCYYPESFNHFTKELGIAQNTVRAVFEDSSGKLWFGTWGGGASCYDGKSFINYDFEEILSGPGHNDIRSIIEDKSGSLWFGTKNGLICFDGKNLIHYNTEQGLPDYGIVHLFMDKKGTIWIGTWEGGLCCWDGKSFTNFKTVKDIGTERVRPFCEDKNGGIWIGSWDKGISWYDGGEIKNYTSTQGLNSNHVYSLVQDKNGNLFIGTDNGVSYFDRKKFENYTTKYGLSNDMVLATCLDSLDNLWIGTMKGLNYLRPSLFFSKTRSKLQEETLHYKYSFGSLDGLKGLLFYQNAIYLDSKNKLWCGTNKALSMLDLNNFEPPESTPSIYLKNIKIQDDFIDYRLLKNAISSVNSGNIKEVNLPKKYVENLKFKDVANFYNYPISLELPYYFNRLSFYFSAIDWSAPHKLLYQYKLDGFDKDWSPLSSENKADYRNLPYGSYTFKVKAIGAANKWSNTIEYNFVINPPWWHTWWARSLFAIIWILAGLLILRWRTAKLKANQKLLEQKVKERTIVVVKQKREIEDKNEELQQQFEEIQSINNSLNEQKEIIEERNTELNAQNEEITTQRDLLSSQNKSISESILYAKRIQTAVMPKQAVIDELFPENFILFRPRDKVSGDFYYVKQINQYKIVVAADCTGHGVPGAILSMLGISFINEIVHKREITKPSDVLAELRRQIKQALKQTGKKGEADDGMDLALVALDTKSKVLQYAGANNPLYLVQNGELKEIRADRMPIGFYPNEKPEFTNHEIQLKPNDIFYLFSDGFMDQFGGKKGFKYKASNFRKILFENHKKPMVIQNELLEQELNNWMKGYDQTDDILVVGVRV